MQDKNFLQRLISHLSPQVFKPVPEGLLYIFLQSISREIGGICPWDEGERCQKGYSQYWSNNCRNMLCPGYRNPVGLIAYTSGSDATTSVDNNFNYSSIRYLTLNDFVPVGTLGVQVRFDLGGYSDPGGYGSGYFGDFYYGDNSLTVATANIVIGDSWTISCTASTGAIGPAVPNPSNKGSYGAISTYGTYTGNHDTTYTVTIIDFWGYIQNFNNALLQMVLATCDGPWIDFWGTYFGIKRQFGVAGFEKDDAYKIRIMQEITEAKGTKAVLLEAAMRYFNSTNVSITEYCQVNGWDGVNPGQNPDGSSDPSRDGLMPYQFYINPPPQTSPSAKFVKAGLAQEVIGTDGLNYTCILSHAADYTNRPIVDRTGTSNSWATYWTQTGTNGKAWVYGAKYVNPSTFTGVKGHYCGTQYLDLSQANQPLTSPVVSVYDPDGRFGNQDSPADGKTHSRTVSTTGDKNDCYVYLEGSWEKPLWQSGLQDTIDRLKTAGTVAIINA